MKQTERWGRQPNCRSLGDCESASRSVSESTSEASKRKDESGQATGEGLKPAPALGKIARDQALGFPG
jgi:hypothetical protein